MTHRFFLIGSLVLLTTWFAAALGDAPAVLKRTDGRAWRLAIKDRSDEFLTVRLENGTRDRFFEIDEVQQIDFSHEPFDETAVEELFQSARYDAVVETLTPVLAPCQPYADFPNNLEESFVLLLRTCLRSERFDRAAGLATVLQHHPDAAVHQPAKAALVLVAAAAGRFEEAEKMRAALADPVGQIYLKARIQQMQNRPEAAMQTAIELLAGHANNLEWMPRTELLCAELYQQMGRVESAAAVARQAAKLYEGRNIGAEARLLQAELDALTDESK